MKPVVVVSIGDINGIGIECFKKSIHHFPNLTFILVCPHPLGVELFPNSQILTEFSSIISLSSGIFIYPFLYNEILDDRLGMFDPNAGNLAYQSFFHAVSLIKKHSTNAILLTLPIHKKSFQSAGVTFKGHTDALPTLLKEPPPLMILANKFMKVGLLTVHIPLSKVSEKITPTGIEETVSLFQKSLIVDWNINTPRIAILGLNPHAGDDGVIGNEEQMIYHPTIEKMKKNGMDVQGPFSADGFFGSHAYKNFDGIMASYHDQGLIALKLSDMDTGVNYSAGCSIIRISPDHGVGYDIAGKNIANPQSTISAIELGLTIWKNRNVS